MRAYPGTRRTHTCPVEQSGCYWIGRSHGGKGAGHSPSTRRRISANGVRGMATSGIWNVTCRPCGRRLSLPASRTSGYGYQRTLRPCRRYVRSSSNSRHSSTDVRFRANFVRFTSRSRPIGRMPRESDFDPKRTLARNRSAFPTGAPSQCEMVTVPGFSSPNQVCNVGRSLCNALIRAAFALDCDLC